MTEPIGEGIGFGFLWLLASAVAITLVGDYRIESRTRRIEMAEKKKIDKRDLTVDMAKVELMVKRRRLMREGKDEEAAEILRIVYEEMGGMNFTENLMLMGNH